VSCRHTTSSDRRRRGHSDKARAILTTAIGRTDLDWPEAVYEALLQFEMIHGDLSSLADAASKIEAEQHKLARRREKANQEQMQQYYAAQPVVQPETTQEVEAQAVEVPQEQPEPTDDSHFKRFGSGASRR